MTAFRKEIRRRLDSLPFENCDEQSLRPLQERAKVYRDLLSDEFLRALRR